MVNIYLNEAYKQALKSLNLNEVPVGAVVVKNDKIISKGYNKKENFNNPFGHAEIIAMKKACKKLGTWHLDGCELYVTLEPCTMCLSAMINARVKKVYYAAIDPRFGAAEGAYNLQNAAKFNHIVETEYIEDNKCSALLSDFFKEKRQKNKKQSGNNV